MGSPLNRHGHNVGLAQVHGHSGKSLGELSKDHFEYVPPAISILFQSTQLIIVYSGVAANMAQTPWVAAFVAQIPIVSQAL